MFVKLEVTSAYEVQNARQESRSTRTRVQYLEKRFDRNVRLAASTIFSIQMVFGRCLNLPRMHSIWFHLDHLHGTRTVRTGSRSQPSDRFERVDQCHFNRSDLYTLYHGGACRMLEEVSLE